ncbi:hypothetical protein GCM10010435_54000 [Winogradskya consettensis]|uniref:DUF3455 domain-containing protein n=1 Tax=Winogradskya consettensis TaxID=113560 RepID=A0A919SGG6_9ACTN|nr:DUF3455 domain-containing protein [Actinoplanes consettensis]GIM71476.1 hypothetical protein Aco04nite_25450 [Actinoplanes consettensis]
MRTHLRTAILGGAAVAVVGALTAVTFNASAAETTARPRPVITSAAPSASASTAPVGINPPAGLRKIGTYKVVKGTQTYTCAAGSFAGASVPEAQLVGTGGWIHHFKGPSWQSARDSSLVTATKVAEKPKTGTIAELLLQVNSHTGTGILSRAAYIQRLNTSGGAAPAGECTDGSTTAVAYNATYVFWG